MVSFRGVVQSLGDSDKKIHTRRPLVTHENQTAGGSHSSQADQEEEKTKGGIIIPDTAKENRKKGKVVAVGKG